MESNRLFVSSRMGSSSILLDSKQLQGREEVFAAARHGSKEAVGELLESYRAYLRMLAIGQLKGRLPARVSPSDVVQETMLAAHGAFGDFRGSTPAEFTCWLRKILSRKLLSTMDRHLSMKRDARREVSIEANFGRGADASGCTLAAWLAAADPSPSTIVSQREDTQRLSQLLLQLPEHYRKVVVLRNNRGMRFEDISVLLDRSPLAARLLWLRAIERLRQLYAATEGA